MGPGGGFVFLVQLPNFLVTQIVCCQDTAREFIWLRRHLQPTRFPLQHSRTACRHAVAPYGPAGRVLVDPLPSLRGGTPKEAEGVCTPPGRHKLELSTINRQKNVAQKKKKIKGKKNPLRGPSTVDQSRREHGIKNISTRALVYHHRHPRSNQTKFRPGTLSERVKKD